MHIINGIVYGQEIQKTVEIVNVKPLDNMIILVTFSNGETRLFDATILNGEVFQLLKDKKIFNNPIIEHGVITWNNGEIDCSPEFIYNNSYDYSVIA